MSLIVNGSTVPLPDDPRVSLLDLLREHLRLTGTKKGCNQGSCGACTVLVDGERIISCLTLAVQVEGRAVTTIEGLADGDRLHPLQQAFVDRDGFQCGYCTPGQICSAIGMAAELERGLPSHVTTDLTADAIAASREELAERMSGNLCRCGAHNGIIDAIAATFTNKEAAQPYRPDMPEVGRMTPFSYARATDAADAVRRAGVETAKYLGGGTNLVDLMRETIERPAVLVDVTGLSATIDDHDGGLLIGAAVRNTGLAENRTVRERSCLGACDPGRRIGADTQHGNGGRQHPAAHAMCLFL